MEALGPVLIVLAIPLLLRWIPQNRVYGLRIPATRRSESVWYDANARFARHLLVLGLLMVALEFVLPLTLRRSVLAAIGWVGLPAILIADWRTANRWERERHPR